MSLTAAQALALRASVKSHNGDAVATAYANVAPQDIANLYNSPASPTGALWRSDIKPSELGAAVVGTDFQGLTVQQQNLMLLLVQLGTGGLDATNANVRASFSTLFSGKVSLTNLIAVAQRNATAYEAISDFLTAAAPANVSSVYGYRLGAEEVRAALWTDGGIPL
jgi:hypothetical protein